MNDQSNLPPGVTDADIENQAMDADVEAAIVTIAELAGEYHLDPVDMIKAFHLGAAILSTMKDMIERAHKLHIEEEEDLELL